MRWLLAIVLALSLLPSWALAQTVVDAPQVKQSGKCEGASTSGAKTCGVTGVTAGDTLVFCTTANIGTGTLTPSETAQSATVNDRKNVVSATAAVIEDISDIVNVAGGTYTFKSLLSGGGTTAQAIIWMELSGVTATPFDAAGSTTSTGGSSTMSGNSATITGISAPPELVVMCGGVPTSEASFTQPASASGVNTAYKAQQTQLSTTPSAIGASVVEGYPAGSNSVAGGKYTMATGSDYIVNIAAYKSSVVPTITYHGTKATTGISAQTSSSVSLPTGISTGDCILISCCGAGILVTPTCSGGGNTYATTLTTQWNTTSALVSFLAPETASATAPTCSWGVSFTGVCVAMAFSGASATCATDGTPAANTSTGSTAPQSPADSGATNADMVMFSSCNTSGGVNGFPDPNPVFANSIGGVGSGNNECRS